ncbi:unnamed protein product, partial [Closterium sp. NIES-64]
PMEDPSTFPNNIFLCSPPIPWRTHQPSPNIVLCGPPMFGAISPRALTEWLHFHRLLLRWDRFVLYDAGGVVDHADVSSAVQPWVRAGVVEVVGFEESTQYDVWSYAQAPSTHDCLYVKRPEAQWLLFAQPSQRTTDCTGIATGRGGCSLLTSLSTHDCLYGNRHGARWLLFADLDELSSGGGAVPVAARLLHEHIPLPGPPVPHQFGHRKYILNPRRVSLAQVSQVHSHPYSARPMPLVPRLPRLPLTDHTSQKSTFITSPDMLPRPPVCRASLAQIHVIIGGDMDGLDLPTDPLVALPRWGGTHGQAARSCPALVTAVPEQASGGATHDGAAKMAQAARIPVAPVPAAQALASSIA